MSLVHDHSADTVPRPALIMAGALVATSLALAASVSLGLAPHEAVPAVARASEGVGVVQTRLLRFADQANGSVLVTDARSGDTLTTIIGETNGGGFVRGVLRGLARDRRMRGIGEAPPFALTLWRDQTLSLVDTATGRSIELGSFGADNRAAFARFLKARSA